VGWNTTAVDTKNKYYEVKRLADDEKIHTILLNIRWHLKINLGLGIGLASFFNV